MVLHKLHGKGHIEYHRRKQLIGESFQLVVSAAIVLSFLFLVSTKVSCALVDSFFSPNNPRYRHSVVPTDKSAGDENPTNDASGQDVSVASRASSSSIFHALTTNKKHTPDTQVAAIIHRTMLSPVNSTFYRTTNDFVYSTSIHKRNDNKIATSCIPEESGYFGATYEAPRVLTYKLNLYYYSSGSDQKSQILPEGISIMNLLLQRAIIADVFPKVCGPVNTNSLIIEDYNPNNYTQGRIIGLKFDMGLQFDVTGKCISRTITNAHCRVYFASVGLYGRFIQNETLHDILQGVKNSLPWIQSEISSFGISGISLASSFQDENAVLKESAGNLMDDLSASITDSIFLSVGAKIGFSLGGMLLLTAFLILFMYVGLDLKYRYNNRTDQELQRSRLVCNFDSDRDNIDYTKGMKLRHESGNNASGVKRSDTGKTETTQSTHCRPYALSSLGTSAVFEFTQIGAATRPVQKSLIVEFASGVDPPLGRPEGAIEDDLNDERHNSTWACRKSKMDDSDDCSIWMSTSIADYSNIDEQIKENDRRKVLKASCS